MNNPLVSVKMITYNHAPYISQAIDSVLMQKTNFPFEIVIGEDFSTDGTREIVFEYFRRYPNIIRVVTSNKNVGIKYNSYRTTKACNGKYIAWCEGDDFWHRPDKLQLQVDYLENHPSCGLVHSDYDRIYSNNFMRICDFNKTNRIQVHDNLSMTEILQGSNFLFILTLTVMAKRELVKRITESDYYIYRSNRFLIGDTPLWAEIAHISGTHYIDDSLATYRVMEESASKFKHPKKQLEFGLNIQELFLYLISKYDLPLDARRYHEKRWGHYALLLSFLNYDRTQSEKAKFCLGTLSNKQMALYLATKIKIVNMVANIMYKKYKQHCSTKTKMF